MQKAALRQLILQHLPQGGDVLHEQTKAPVAPVQPGFRLWPKATRVPQSTSKGRIWLWNKKTDGREVVICSKTNK